VDDQRPFPSSQREDSGEKKIEVGLTLSPTVELRVWKLRLSKSVEKGQLESRERESILPQANLYIVLVVFFTY